MKPTYFLIICFSLIHFNCFSQNNQTNTPEFLQHQNNHWADSVFQTLSLDEKIGQLLMPRGNYSGKDFNVVELEQWVEKYHIGGLALFAGNPSRHAEVINLLQEKSEVPLMIGMDFEWGLNMRLDSTVKFPYQLTLGAMQGNTEMIEQMAAEIGRQCRRMGVHVNYAPVADVNNNPNNPVINFRSFGENREDVAQKTLAYMRGLQSEHIIATAKHFPGHGDTDTDSHYDLPVLNHPLSRLQQTELYPFQQLINNGLSGIMTAHLSVAAMDNRPNRAATLSEKIINGYLKNEMNFQGLVFTDAMDMQGITKHFPDGEAIVLALESGNDVLETFVDVPTAFTAIQNAVKSGRLSEEMINEKVKKILLAKAWVGLNHYHPIDTNNLIDDLNTSNSEYLNREFAEKSLVLLQNKSDHLPVRNLEQNLLFVSLDSNGKTDFQKMADNYTTPVSQNLPANYQADQLTHILQKSLEADQVIVGLHMSSVSPYNNYGITDKNKAALSKLLQHQNVTVVLFGNAYSLLKLPDLSAAKSIILTGENSKYAQEAAAQAIFGAISFQGKLPVTVNDKYKFGMGIEANSIGRLSYGVAEQVGLESEALQERIDSVVHSGLDAKAYPGAVVQVAKNGRVIYRKAYGFHTYEDAEQSNHLEENQEFQEGNQDVMDADRSLENQSHESEETIDQIPGKVQLDDIYDMASVTKISTSALAVMQLMSENKFDLDATFGDYEPRVVGTNKQDLTFRDMLTHRSGLKAWIPFWRYAVDTTETVEKALEQHPDWIDLFEKKKKTGFFLFRIFKKRQIDTVGTVENNTKLWADILTKDNITWKENIFSSKQQSTFDVEIADTLWMNRKFQDSVFQMIIESPVKPEQGYVYSDLHYYFYPGFISKLAGKAWEDYLKETYHTLGANSLTFNPRRFYSLDKIVPTELDEVFRKTQIHGRVHDEGAAMLDGLSGHAGLFGNANDLMKLMQMYLQEGFYGGKQYIKPEVVKEVTRYQFNPEENRRAIAFDKLAPDKSVSNGPQEASELSYGHSGYTGTFTWIDPKYDLVYVILTNRVYPTRENTKIARMNIRTDLGNVILKTVKESE